MQYPDAASSAHSKFMATAMSGTAPSAAAPVTGTAANQNFLESVLPGIGNMTSSATSAIQNMLNGLPSVSQARTNNAYFGVGAGQPDTGGVGTFTATRGADLYGQQAQANKQQGIQNLFGAIGAYSQPILSNQSQQLQNQQFNSNLGQQANQFDQQFQLQKFQAMLQAMGLGNQIVGAPTGNIPTP